MGIFRELRTHGGGKHVADPVTQIDDLVRYMFREHNQEADHLANIGAEGQRKITVEKGNNTEHSKAVRGFWDGSKKTDGRTGCGVVIKGVDRDRWITISKIAVFVKAWAAMAAEVVGASVLTKTLEFGAG